MKVKCYCGNYDGTRTGMVVANSKKAAAKIANSSLYDFNNYWGQVAWPKDWTPKAFTLYTKRFGSDAKWFEDRCP